MKKIKASGFFFLLLVLALALMLCTVGCRKDDTSSIVGGWEVEAQVINSDSTEDDASGLLQFYFYDDLTGVEVTTSLGKTEQRNFTYQVSEDTLRISFETGTVWNFPYSLKKDVLVLKQNYADITYHRIA